MEWKDLGSADQPDTKLEATSPWGCSSNSSQKSTSLLGALCLKTSMGQYIHQGGCGFQSGLSKEARFPARLAFLASSFLCKTSSGIPGLGWRREGGQKADAGGLLGSSREDGKSSPAGVWGGMPSTSGATLCLCPPSPPPPPPRNGSQG